MNMQVSIKTFRSVGCDAEFSFEIIVFDPKSILVIQPQPNTINARK